METYGKRQSRCPNVIHFILCRNKAFHSSPKYSILEALALYLLAFSAKNKTRGQSRLPRKGSGTQRPNIVILQSLILACAGINTSIPFYTNYSIPDASALHPLAFTVTSKTRGPTRLPGKGSGKWQSKFGTFFRNSYPSINRHVQIAFHADHCILKAHALYLLAFTAKSKTRGPTRLPGKGSGIRQSSFGISST